LEANADDNAARVVVAMVEGGGVKHEIYAQGNEERVSKATRVTKLHATANGHGQQIDAASSIELTRSKNVSITRDTSCPAAYAQQSK
jgi:hypothetical protein